MCPSCHKVEPLSQANIDAMKNMQAIRCPSCREDDLRFKVMLYDDDEVRCCRLYEQFTNLDVCISPAPSLVLLISALTTSPLFGCVRTLCISSILLLFYQQL